VYIAAKTERELSLPKTKHWLAAWLSGWLERRSLAGRLFLIYLWSMVDMWLCG